MNMKSGFDDSRAKGYDVRVRQHIPGYELMHRLCETVLAAELPENASLLIVGAGTGHEIVEWGPKHPGWRFAGTDPSAPMLELAKTRIAAAGLLDRTELHAVLTEQLPAGPYDAATVMLVMHFLSDEQKAELLSAIADRLSPGAPVLIANLFGDPGTTRYKRMNDYRKAAAMSLGMSLKDAEEFCDPARKDLFIVPEERLKVLLRDAGYIDVQRLVQSFAVGLWLARTPR